MTRLASAPRTWQQVLGDQDGVLSRAQALDAGLSDRMWQWRISSGRWQRVLPGVAVAHSGPVTDQQLVWAAVLHAGPGAALSGDAALVQHGLRTLSPAVLQVALPEQRLVQPQTLVGRIRLEPHRVRRLPRWVHPVSAPAVVRVAPAVLHAAAWATSDRAAEWRLAAAVQQRLARPADLRAALAEMPRLRRRALVRAVLDDVELGAHAGSELDFLGLLRAHDLPRPDLLQRPVRRGSVRYLDAWWDRQRVTVEVDGAHHRLVGTWDEDALRGNEVVLGERHDRVLLLRYTRTNLRHDEPRVVRQLRAALL